MEEPQKAKAQNIFTDDPALITAQKSFGIEYLYPWQRLVIANILESADNLEEENKDNKSKQIVLLPTGAGKSLCFLIPSILLPGATLVMYPLLALMSDQKRRMDEGGIPNAVFQGGQSDSEREENFKKIEAGAKIILANPEVLQNSKLVERLAKYNIIHAAIDEAHCVSEWGDSFRPAYLTLGKILKKLNIPLVTAFTATASPQVLQRVSEILFDGEAHIVRSESDRPNIHYNVIYSYAKEKEILHLVLTQQRPIIIFCGTRKNAEETARNIRAFFAAIQNAKDDYYNSPDVVKFYHAGLSRNEKTKVEQWFFPKENAILCSTCAFGMGVDKKNIRTVIHKDVPTTVESFIQESGRGARDGGIAQSYLLWNYSDKLKFSTFEQGSRARALLDFAESSTCRRQVLLDALGAEQAACEGCDICKAKQNIKDKANILFIPPKVTDAHDRNFVLHLLNKFSRSWDRMQALEFIQNKMNKHFFSIFNMNVWETSDIANILEQLEQEKKIRTCGWPWKNKITIIPPQVTRKTKNQLIKEN